MLTTTFALEMRLSFLHKFLLVWLLAGSVLLSQGCVFGHRASKQVRQAERAADEMAKEQNAEFEKAYKQHMENQSDLTKLQMKAMKKRQKKANRGRKRSLWDRIFNNKCYGAGITM